MESSSSGTETLIDEIIDVTTDSKIRLQPDGGHRVDGPGTLDTVMVRAQSPNYQIVVETDKATVTRDDWATLNNVSTDLTHIDAYEDRGRYVIKIHDIPYKLWASAEIDAREEITFERVRGIWVIDHA